MKSVQKYKKTKYLSFKNGQSFQIYEMAKVSKFMKWPNVFFLGQRTSKMANLATLRQRWIQFE